MDIERIKKFVSKHETGISDGLRERLDRGELATEDIQFFERCMNVTLLAGLANDISVLAPTFIEATMRLRDLKNHGETEVDIDYALNLANDLANWFVELKEKLADIGFEFSIVES